MPNQSITVIDNETGNQEKFNTDGFLLLYLDEHAKIRMTGKLDMKVLTPIISKAILERISR